tara:strand:- start:2276 stop:2656 length:381 start_codon:yes stop_codon:yes gene_type:complete
MRNNRLVEEYDTEVGTSYTGFEIKPTTRVQQQIPLLIGTLSAVFIYCDTHVNANAITVRITEDVQGDECIIADTQVGLALGVTTPTKTSSILKIEIDVADTWPTMVWIKTDTGTLNVRKIKFTWRD